LAIEVLRNQQIRRLAFAGLFSRSATAVVPIAITLSLALEGRSRSAGFVISAYLLTVALSAPPLGRLLDRHNQQVILGVSGGSYVASLLSISILLSQGGSAEWLLITLGLVAGLAYPPLGAVLRPMWRRVADNDSQTRKAHVFDSFTEKASFVIGPLIVALAIGQIVWLPVVAAAVIATSNFYAAYLLIDRSVNEQR